MSGVFGAFSKDRLDLARSTYYGLFALQHRGQESCGIVVNDDGVFNYYKDSGIVNDVFTVDVLNKLGEGQMALGQVRYGTDENDDRLNSQPVVVNHHKGKMAIAMDGQLVNGSVLRKKLEMEGSIFHTKGDAEVISYMITKARLVTDSIEDAVKTSMNTLEGAYTIIVMSPSKMIVARDPYGFRPLCYGQKEDGTYIIASESCAIDSIGGKFIRDIEPGEIVIFEKNGIRNITDHCNKQKEKLCIFEYIYFSRPDSVIEGISVHEARKKAGACLALEHPVQADVIIGVPDSGLDAAIGYAAQSGIPYGIGFIKNKYIGRTFIDPGQKVREDKVRIKLNVLSATVAGKRVVIVDDSIVRGTTIAKIVKRLREAGATEVHVRSAAPPFTDPCYYGTDVDSKDKLIACQHTKEEITKIIDADSLGYLNINHLNMLIGKPDNSEFCYSCFTGEYPTSIPEAVMDEDKFSKKISSNK